jgi:protocatechuate 3,4-dioxygenase alpha subunit
MVRDGAGDPVPDALVEIWQADEQGVVPSVEGSLARDGWTFTGFGRAATDATGRYCFTTVRPGASQPGRPPFIAVTVFARGLLHRLQTRAYLPLDEPAAAADPVLSALPVDRRQTLVAQVDEHGLVFDIHLQGPLETVFLDFGDS